MTVNINAQRRSASGNHGRMDKERAEADYYRSPPHAMALLLDTIAPARLVPDGGLIIDAGAGDGRLTRPLIEAGYRVRGIELYDRNHDPALPIDIGIDFMSLTPHHAGRPAAIVTNPPYSLNVVDCFLRHSMSLLPDGGELHALMRHNWMTGIRRNDLLPSLSRIVMCRRLKMLPFEREHDDKGYQAMADFSWFTFEKGRTEGACELLHARQ